MPIDITEYSTLPNDAAGKPVLTGLEPAQAQQQVEIGAVSAQSAVFNEVTRFIRLHADSACRIEFGTNPTATAASRRMAAGATEFVGVRPGLRIAVIQTT